MNTPWTVTRAANGEFEITDNGGDIVLYMTDETPDELQGKGYWERDVKQWMQVVEIINALHRPLKSQEIQCAALSYGPKSFPTRIKAALECYRVAVLKGGAC